MAILDYKDGRPIYEQIAEHYKRLILCGAMGEDEKLPSVRELAMELSTNPNTVQKAYEKLEREGFSYTVKGRGRFVKSNTGLVSRKRDEIAAQIAKLLQEATEIGLDVDMLMENVRERMKKND